MIYGQAVKTVVLVAASSAATNATASASVDTLGYHGAVFTIGFAKATATNNTVKWAALQLLVGDDTSYSNATAVSGLVGTTNTTAATNEFLITAPTNTSVFSVIKLGIDKIRGRYVFIQYQPSTGYNTFHIQADLYNADQAPSSATEEGAVVSAYATR